MDLSPAMRPNLAFDVVYCNHIESEVFLYEKQHFRTRIHPWQKRIYIRLWDWHHRRIQRHGLKAEETGQRGICLHPSEQRVDNNISWKTSRSNPSEIYRCLEYRGKWIWAFYHRNSSDQGSVQAESRYWFWHSLLHISGTSCSAWQNTRRTWLSWTIYDLIQYNCLSEIFLYWYSPEVAGLRNFRGKIFEKFLFFLEGIAAESVII